MAGFLLGSYIRLDTRTRGLEKELKELQALPGDDLTAESTPSGHSSPKPSSPDLSASDLSPPETPPELESTAVIKEISDTGAEGDPDAGMSLLKGRVAEDAVSVAYDDVATDVADRQIEEQLPKTPSPLDGALQWIKAFFTSGNIMVKIGVSVLFFGVAFLVKYAADHDFVSLELRLTGVAVAGVIMLVFGWRLREKKPAYALVIQGGALGVLYITVFAAFRLYDLLPAMPAFSILFVLAALSAVLAVTQNSLTLAVLGMSGGFLAPILTSTGSGNYVALFSYYLLLNLGILAIALFRSWRILNLLGFLFTFSVATAWGIKYYQPANLSSTEPFLIIFFLLYVVIAILFAFRQPLKLRGYVDSTLVFGVPLVAFGLQAGMVNHIEYALAWSSLVLAVFYSGLSVMLWQRIQSGSRLICEAFFALGIIFATLAVPLALDAQWTSGFWALEGAAAVWAGIRQNRFLPRLLGYLLQLASGLFYIKGLTSLPADDRFILNGEYLGALVMSLSGLFIAWQLSSGKQPDKTDESGVARLFQWERQLSLPLLIWGLVWWYGAGIHEINEKISNLSKPLSGILFVSFSACLLQWFKQKLDWFDLRIPALSLLPVLYLLFPLVVLTNEHPFADWNVLAWGVALLVNFWILKQYDGQRQAGVPGLHMASFWMIALLLSSEAAWQANHFMNDTGVWWFVAAASVTALLMFLMYRYGEKISWPVARHRQVYQLGAIQPLAFVLWAAFIAMNLFSDGDARPLPYIPFLNPLDLVLAIQMIVLIYWQRVPLTIEDWKERHWRFDTSQLLLALSLFLWMNTMWLRLAHHAWDVDFDFSEMMASKIIQAGTSILWGVTGLLCMIVGTRRGLRYIWLGGASVMAAVVVKLFLFDLANTGTVERIVSFMSVGILLLVVGYFAPVPPSKKVENSS